MATVPQALSKIYKSKYTYLTGVVLGGFIFSYITLPLTATETVEDIVRSNIHSNEDRQVSTTQQEEVTAKSHTSPAEKQIDDEQIASSTPTAEPESSSLPTEKIATALEQTIAPTPTINEDTSEQPVLAASENTTTEERADGSIKATTPVNEVTLPRTAAEGITLSAELPTGENESETATQQLHVSLPNSSDSESVEEVSPGVVAYANVNSTNAVQTMDNGGVRMLTVIDNPDAPTSYDYAVNVPEGGRIEVLPEGDAIVVDANDQLIAIVDKPWAKDANGVAVGTHFTTDGQTLTQHVEHNVAGVAYPVVADPVWLPAWAIYRLALCGVGGIGGFIYGGGRTVGQNLYNAAIGCLGFTAAKKLFRR